ncbi:uncharacterized protein LOC106130655 [Amyelois transitella]|uniref:uncharacterized protein LOC106130655 n=1 Tax=Amyelois transitella TaxID=680683 RepID=UPI00067B5AF4|nr:uncharacterized protein LOC106130655 [Amyelois transitella]
MMSLQTFIVITFVALTKADEAYENKLTKLWSLSSASNSDGSVNVTSTSIVIQPSGYNREARINNKYAFKPRAIPLIRDQPSNVYYSQDVKYKPKMLFSGNYIPIAAEKGNENLTESTEKEPFHPRDIPLIRSQEFQRRSLDVDEEPTIEKPEGFTEQAASRRSISYMLGLDGEDPEEEEEEEEEYEYEEAKGGKKKIKKPKLKLKSHKLKKYVVPLLMAYKMKYFALVPVLIGGLILLVGATGLAGFFFALFAAVMGLQKGAY